MMPNELVRFLRGGPGDATAWLTRHPSVAALLDRTTGGGYRQIVSEHLDSVREVTRGYGESKRPEDYLEAFRAFLQTSLNTMPALLVVTQRPRDLTREDLRKLREAKNQDIAATIIGYIRQLALGSPLVPYSERVDRGLQRLLKAHKFTEPQRKWLTRIADQVKLETVVDRDSLDRGQFQAQGGFARMNKVFEGTLETLLGEFADEVWRDAG